MQNESSEEAQEADGACSRLYNIYHNPGSILERSLFRCSSPALTIHETTKSFVVIFSYRVQIIALVIYEGMPEGAQKCNVRCCVKTQLCKNTLRIFLLLRSRMLMRKR